MEIGKVYDVNHSRKGKFRARVLSETGPGNDDFVDLQIVSGEARFMSDGGYALGEGEKVTARRSLMTWTEVAEAA